jgi:sugar phosphate isomerase/epimerase
MRKIGDWPLGVCTWSLGNDLERVGDVLDQNDLSHIHLACGALTDAPGREAWLRAIETRGWVVTSTMVGFPTEDYSTLDSIRRTGGIVPDEHWPANREIVMDALKMTAELGVGYLSFHAGFLDMEDSEYARKLMDRMADIADAASDRGIVLLMETGQESAEELCAFFDTIEHPALGVNFDPANMILYDKDDPVDAVAVLGPWIRHVHIKDAVRTRTPGEWGAEVPWGEGEVPVDAFLRALAETGFDGALAIERESGDNRIADIGKAAERLSHD